jgi:hypothetical protein
MSFEPFLGVDFVRADNCSDFIVEDFCRGSWQRFEASVLETKEIGIERLLKPTSTLSDLECGEAMNVDIGNRVSDGTGNIDVVVAVEIGMDSTLKADFSCTEIGRLTSPLGDVVEGE